MDDEEYKDITKKLNKFYIELKKQAKRFRKGSGYAEEPLIVAIFPDFLIGKSSIYPAHKTIIETYEVVDDFFKKRSVSTLHYPPEGMGGG